MDKLLKKNLNKHQGLIGFGLMLTLLSLVVATGIEQLAKEIMRCA